MTEPVEPMEPRMSYKDALEAKKEMYVRCKRAILVSFLQKCKLAVGQSKTSIDLDAYDYGGDKVHVQDNVVVNIPECKSVLTRTDFMSIMTEMNKYGYGGTVREGYVGANGHTRPGVTYSVDLTKEYSSKPVSSAPANVPDNSSSLGLGIVLGAMFAGGVAMFINTRP